MPFRFLLLLTANGSFLLDNRKPIAADGDLYSHSVIGIEGFVKRGDLSLFSSGEVGLLDAAVGIIVQQFNLPPHILPVLEDASRWSKAHAVIDAAEDRSTTEIVVYLSLRCAEISGIAEVIGALDRRMAFGANHAQ